MPLLFFFYIYCYFCIFVYTEAKLFIKCLSTQDLTHTKLREAASPGALYCPGIPGQAISDGGLQV